MTDPAQPATQQSKPQTTLECAIVGCGAWGPGFSNWDELAALLLSTENSSTTRELIFNKPAPQIIPANERRRAPLLVKMAVETSCQAITAADLPAQEAACVFASGLGDTDVTDYLCRALTTELKQLSPTKFHNSVHNTAAGYWTISTGCMESANSIAGYQHTVGITLLEAVSQCVEQQKPILVTIYDTEVNAVFSELFHCSENVALSLLIAPTNLRTSALRLSLSMVAGKTEPATLGNSILTQKLEHNPTAQLLTLMAAIAKLQQNGELQQNEKLQQGEIDQVASLHFSVGSQSSIIAQLEKFQ